MTAAILPVAFGLAGLATSKMMAPKAPEAPQMVPQIQRRANPVSDALASRMGSIANRKKGDGEPMGAAGSGNLKSKLGQ